MKTTTRCLCLLALLGLLITPALLSWACEPAIKAGELEFEVPDIAKKNNLFGWAMLDQVTSESEEPENLIFSPMSIHTTVFMASLGAKGETLSQMDDVLEIAELREDYAPGNIAMGYELLLDDLQPENEANYQLMVANAMWGQKGYPWDETFENELETHFDAPVQEIDFAQSSKAADKINNWVADKTNDKITDLVSADDLTDDVRLMLVNTVYFKAKWQSTFEKHETSKKDFTVSEDETIEVDMMFQEEYFDYFETDDLQVVAMPYEGRDVSMVVILPRDDDGLADARQWMTDGNLCANVENLERKNIAISLPKFTIRTTLNLKDTLEAMGMTDAFTESADFSGMSPNATEDKLHIFDAVHQAFIKVDEDGTEAAAATGMWGGVTSIPPEPIEFNADHPFVFVLRHNPTGEVLFAGQVVRPENKDE